MYKKTNVIIIMLLLCFMMIITPIQLLEAKKKRGGKKKRDHIVDERIDKVMQFSEQLVKDGHLFDGSRFHLLQILTTQHPPPSLPPFSAVFASSQMPCHYLIYVGIFVLLLVSLV